ncbi:MAG: FAD-binding oxidoreductase [Chloroflexota bacterium]
MSARRRRVLAILGAGAIASALGIREMVTLAAPPTDAKDCPPLRPLSFNAPSGPTGSGAERLPWSQRGGTINDVSCLDRTPVHGVVRVTTEDEIRDALSYARGAGLKVAMAGARHSMGGHAFASGALILDVNGYNRVQVSPDVPSVTVQTGAKWLDIQAAIHPRFAVKAMQSTNIFTVAGSISVNAHGMDHRVGSVERTIRWLRLMLADGTVVRLSRQENSEIFRHVVGGYGLFGVILDAEIEITQNLLYKPGRKMISYRDFPTVFEREILPDPSIGLMYGHLSTARGSFLQDMMLFLYTADGTTTGNPPPLSDVSQIGLRRLVFNLSKGGGALMDLKWWAERTIEPRLEGCSVTAADVAGACYVTRNDPMHDSAQYLFNSLEGETDILQEYFVPRERLVAFLDAARPVLRDSGLTLLNASVRVAHQENIALNYAPADMFALVLYVNQKTDRAGNEAMARLTRTMVDLCVGHGGRFFLPYQLHFTPLQLRAAYPEIDAFFAAKRRYDPGELFSSTFYETYRA